MAKEGTTVIGVPYYAGQNPYQAGIVPPNAIYGDPLGAPIQQTIYRDTPAPFNCLYCGNTGLTNLRYIHLYDFRVYCSRIVLWLDYKKSSRKCAIGNFGSMSIDLILGSNIVEKLAPLIIASGLRFWVLDFWFQDSQTCSFWLVCFISYRMFDTSIWTSCYKT